MTSTSRQRVRVVVNGKLYLVEVGDLTASPITVHVNGRPYSVQIERVESAKTSIGVSAAALKSVARGTPQNQVPQLGGPAGLGVDEVRAPMPGNILDIAVRPGDQVEYRQQLCSLEAMKMKTAIRSPRAGTIASVEVVEGEAVAHSDLLFTFQ